MGKECFELGDGDLGEKPEDRPCEEGEVWAEVFANTGIGGCFKKDFKRINRIFDRIPLNTHHKKKIKGIERIFDSIPLNTHHNDWKPLPRRDGDPREYCGRCFRNGKVHICCEGDGIGPR